MYSNVITYYVIQNIFKISHMVDLSKSIYSKIENKMFIMEWIFFIPTKLEARLLNKLSVSRYIVCVCRVGRLAKALSEVTSLFTSCLRHTRLENTQIFGRGKFNKEEERWHQHSFYSHKRRHSSTSPQLFTQIQNHFDHRAS